MKRAGGVFNAHVFTVVLLEVRRLMEVGPVLILVVYAAQRSLLAAWLQHSGINSTTSPKGDSPDTKVVLLDPDTTDVLQLLTARQARGGTRIQAIACCFRRFAEDPDFIGSATDPAKSRYDVADDQASLNSGRRVGRVSG